jgi:hypothetical protein
MTAVYMTVQGRSRDTTRAIAASRARFGVESSKDWLEGYGPQFLDFPFTDPDATFADHLTVCRETCPPLTVAPDVERGRTLATVTRKADRLAEYARTVVVVPKDCHPSDVPDRFRVGVTAANFGSNAPWNVWDYRNCGPVHILGGPPARQLEIGKHLPVASVDTATLGQRCRFGMWDGQAIDAPDGLDYRERLEQSLNNYVNVWNV